MQTKFDACIIQNFADFFFGLGRTAYSCKVFFWFIRQCTAQYICNCWVRGAKTKRNENRHVQKEKNVGRHIVRDHYSTVNNRHLAEPFCFSWYTTFNVRCGRSRWSCWRVACTPVNRRPPGSCAASSTTWPAAPRPRRGYATSSSSRLCPCSIRMASSWETPG